ncbi:MAG: TraB/GumN family protein [Gammaproteobacteria bacterium]|nr:MAG: TraB/GumN family protein [Gammaproteobacteria bacterium]
MKETPMIYRAMRDTPARRLTAGMAALALLLFTWLGAAQADVGQPAAWALERDDSRIVLLGSIHLLPPGMAELPTRVRELYEHADTLIMELAMDQLDPVAFQREVNRLGSQPEGGSLAASLGEARWQEAQALAREIDLDLMLLGNVKPWLAALTITQLRLVQLGFAAEFGLEVQLTGLAVRDGKPIEGLETAEAQLGVFAGLSNDEQIDMLMQSLGDAVTLRDDVDTIVSAWRSGDVARMDDELLAPVRESPGLYEAVVVQRNRDWIAPIEALLERPGTHLVVVGALHLVGEDSVVAMLEARGHALQRL